MSKRHELEARIKDKQEQIKSLKSEIIEIKKDALLLSDDEQRFTEEIESHPRQKFQRKDDPLDGRLIGRIHWKQDFRDESTGDIISIDRNEIVRIDGKWVAF